MASRVRAHMRSNVVAYVALFFAISGVAVAAPQFIKNGDPAGGDLTGTYPNPLIDASAVNGAKVADGSLRLADIAQSVQVGTFAQTLAGGACTHREAFLEDESLAEALALPDDSGIASFFADVSASTLQVSVPGTDPLVTQVIASICNKGPNEISTPASVKVYLLRP